MKRLLATLLLGTALSGSAFADPLTIGILPDNQVVPQSASAPCIICATTQAHNPAGFGYNNFDSTGNDSSFNLFSSNLTGSFGNGIEGTPYTTLQLSNFLTGFNDFGLTFGVAVDINTAGGAQGNKETLEVFQLINLDGAGGNPEVVFNLAAPFAMPNIRNGNGSADYLITGFNLSGIDAGDRLLFRAQWSGATDGGESFYIVPIINGVPVPGPVVASGIPGLIAAAGGLLGLAWRRRRKQLVG